MKTIILPAISAVFLSFFLIGTNAFGSSIPDDECSISADWTSGECVLTSNTDRYTFVVNYPKGHTCMVKFATEDVGMRHLADALEFYLGFDFSRQGLDVLEKLPLLGTNKSILGGTGSEYYYMAFFTIKTKSGKSLNKVIGENLSPTSDVPAKIRITGVDCVD